MPMKSVFTAAIAILLAAAPVSFADSKPMTAAGAGVHDIAVQVAEIDKHLQSIDKSVQSVKGIEKQLQQINATLAQVASVLREENLRAIEASAGDVILARGALLILLGTLCGAGLMFLQARLRPRPVTP
ncbi:MAG TPA: hypothetical protein VLT60_05470 [Usitatibacter sp.]|nr:hypothetical protein [Usitatibacter sp.]